MSLLRVSGLHLSYGAIAAVRGVDLEVQPGEIVTVLGANGAGKTTLMNGLMGMLPPTGGTVMFRDQDVTTWSTESRVRAGMTLTPEGRQIFATLTIAENLLLGGAAVPASRRNDTRQQEILDMFPILATRRDQAAGTLSGGEQQQLAIARSLMSAPELLLLDEPSLGLAPLAVETVFRLVTELPQRGVTVVIVEQHTDRALGIADRGYVLAHGEVAISGAADELLGSDVVRQAYLGEDG